MKKLNKKLNEILKINKVLVKPRQAYVRAWSSNKNHQANYRIS